MKPVFYYCYDAYCGWCYGFSSVIYQLWDTYKSRFQFEVLSGGMIPKESAKPISTTAAYILSAYPRIEELSTVKFGEDYLWHLKHADESDWIPHSEMAAVALAIVRDQYPKQQIPFIKDIQYALFTEGRDLTDPEAYRHLLQKYNLDAADFYQKLSSEAYIEKAHYDFALCRQLQVTGFPKLLLQVSDNKFYLVAQGFTSLEAIEERVHNILSEIKQQ